jgi:hypothetical protein
MSIELVNRGIAIEGDYESVQGRPVVVVGVARGGTSMVAGALHKMGLFMGDRAVSPVFEDVRLSEVFESGDLQKASSIAAEYTSRYGVWGWKRPSCVNYLDDVDSVLGSPRYIFIFKDLFSIAQRNSISMLTDTLHTMKRAGMEYGRILEFIEKREPVSMLVSYEKAVADPRYFIAKLAEFLMIDPVQEKLESAEEFVSPNPPEYLEKSRITKTQGRLGGINGRKIYGWARYVHRIDSALVDIYLNDELLSTVKADRPRADLLERFGQACAFVYNIPEDLRLKVGDTLRARVRNDIRDLENSYLEIDSEILRYV